MKRGTGKYTEAVNAVILSHSESMVGGRETEENISKTTEMDGRRSSFCRNKAGRGEPNFWEEG
jgi:hypothetical protein